MMNFEKYLFQLLFECGEDCCSKCAYCPPITVDDVCDNLKNPKQDLDVCLDGMKKYFDKLNKE